MQNPYEDYIKIIDVILRKIEADPLAKIYKMEPGDFPDAHSTEQRREQINFLLKLVSKKAISKINEEGFSFARTPANTMIFAHYVHEPNKKLLLKERRRLMEFEKISNKESDGQPEIINLFLSADGDLYREPKNKYCYPLSKEKMREKIIRFLAGKNYQQTITIQGEVGSADAQSIRLAIAKINSNAKSSLGIKNKLIEGRKDSGYRINPQYKIAILQK
jgi:hypothetical protein